MLNDSKQQLHKKSLNHLNRIQGQINVLKKYIEDDYPCHEIAQLTASITSSFKTLKMKTLKSYIQYELLNGTLSEKKQVELKQILKLHKQ